MKFEIGDEVVYAAPYSKYPGQIVTNAFCEGERYVIYMADEGMYRMVGARDLTPAPKPEYCALLLGYFGSYVDACSWADVKLKNTDQLCGHLVRDRPDALPAEWRWEPVEVQS